METTIKNWYVVYTKPGCERKVLDLLERKNIPSSTLAHKKVDYSNSDDQNVVPFKRMIFVFISEEELPEVKKIRGVCGFMFRMQKLAIVDTADITALQNILHDSGKIILEKIRIRVNDFEASNKMRSLSKNDFGTGNIGSVKKIYLHSLGYAIIIDVQVDQSKREEVKIEQIKSVA